MSETLKDHESPELPAGTVPVTGHDEWFKEQIERGLKEAMDTPETRTPMRDVLKDLDL